MSSRKVVVVMLVVLFALSVTAFAVVPAAQTESVRHDGVTMLAAWRFDFKTMLADPVCPGPQPNGC